MYENHFGDKEYFDLNTKESNFEYGINNEYKFTINAQFCLKFYIIENNSYSIFMIKLGLLSYGNPIRAGFLTLEDIMSLNEELESFAVLSNKKFSSLCLSYVLMPCGNMDGMMYIGKDDEDGDFFELGFHFKEFNTINENRTIEPKFTFIIDAFMFDEFISMIYDILLRLPFY